MRYPPFIAEMAQPANRAKLWFGVWSGFVIAVAFGGLGVAAHLAGSTSHGWEFLALVACKLLTNAIAMVCLRRNTLVLPSQGLNTVADIVVMTAAIYLTGGAISPLLPIYVIEIVVLTLLSNLGVTLMATGLTIACYASMVVAIAVGWLPPTTPVGIHAAPDNWRFVAVAIGYCLFVVGVPMAFVSATRKLLRQREDELMVRTAELIKLGTQRTQFVASLTHELRTPIHGVSGLSDMLGQGVYGELTAKQREVCATIHRSAKSLLTLVDDMLNVTKADAGKLEVVNAQVDAQTLVDGVVGSVAWMIQTKKHDLRVAVPPGLTVTTDGRWLAHILVNLIANAVKFTPANGHIQVLAAAAAGGVEFAVIDDGIGIAKADHAAVFEPFRQVQGGDTRGFGGVGLGLALVARLSALIGATVTIDSDRGRGTTFRVVVPNQPLGNGVT